MKISPLLVASATALETSSTAHHLLAAVGQRNVSHMEALVQGLADESVQVPAWKFDEDIRNALDAIRNIFVGNIQKALNEQHKVDQEHLNCETETCFMGCINDYKKTQKDCVGMDAECKRNEDAHYKCRYEVYTSYVGMAKSCASLHCFIHDWKDDPCPTEECLCPDLTVCHMSSGGYDEQCIARIGDCKATYGAWLLKMIGKFESGYKTWLHLHTECKKQYHAFLHVDMDCDAKQKEFESCKCQQNSCTDRACTVQFEQCQIGCWDRYEVVIKEKECLEKDRKIDWSATKKIECYIDILLHDYTKEELLTKFGTETCVNKARETDYAHCHTICLEVDHEGAWPQVHAVNLKCGEPGSYGSLPQQATQYASQTAWIEGHHPRSKHDQYHLGDSTYKCDANGAEVMTRHRGGDKDRVGEARCTEHLDIDYQIPPCCDCDVPPEPVCDEAFHCRYYGEFDDITLISEISDCCPEDCEETCFPDAPLKILGYAGKVCATKFSEVMIPEHSHAWAFNRCPCVGCTNAIPSYDVRHQKCGDGPQTILTIKGGY
jgi:hypothetical protein